MADKHEISPGTVSKILWHFTGGPTWNSKTKKQTNSQKPAADAYENLKSILRSKEVRLGTYKEVVKVILPQRRKYNVKTRSFDIGKDVPVDIESSSICCVSDVPAAHLRYHAYRYGKFALGFHRNAIIRAGFNPVFYTLQNTPIVRSIYEGFSSLKVTDIDMIRSYISMIETDFSDVEDIVGGIHIELSDYISDIECEVESIEDAISDARKSIEDFVAFVKTFEESEFSTVYCEREWRSTNAYKFKIDDLAMIVLPQVVGNKKYYKNFVEKVASNIKLPRRIPIVPWDDLVEH